MAWLFDADTDVVTITDNAALTLPNADWAIGGWVKPSTNSITVAVRLYDHTGGTAAANLLFLPVAAGNVTDEIQFTLDDTSGQISVASTSSPFSGNTSWTHVLMQRNGTNIEVYVNGSSVISTSGSGLDSVNPTGNFTFGNNASLNRPFRGSQAEWAKWDRALIADEIISLAKNYSPIFFRNSLVWYCPMLRDYTEVKSGLTVTNSGTTITDHPAIIYPSYTIIGTKASSQIILPPLIDPTTQLFAPTFAPGAFTISLPLISSTETMYAPTLAPQAQNITIPLIATTVTFFNPTLAVGSVNIAPPLIDPTTQLFAPEILNASQQNLDLPFISSTTTLYEPSLSVGAVNINTPLLENNTQLFAPSLVPGNVNIGMPAIASTVTMYPPSLTSTYNLSMPVIGSTNVLYGPTFVVGALTVPMPFISAATQLFPPNFVFGQTIAMPTISGNTTLYAPTISFSFSKLEPNTNTDFVQVD